MLKNERRKGLRGRRRRDVGLRSGAARVLSVAAPTVAADGAIKHSRPPAPAAITR